MIKKLFVIFIILTSVSFFQFTFIPGDLSKYLEILVPSIMLLLIFVTLVYDDSVRFRKQFKIEFVFLLIGLVLSVMGAYYFHGQALKVTLITQRFVYFLLLYFLLHAIKPHPDFIIRLMIYFGLFYAIIYIIQAIIYPIPLTTADMFIDRGTVRIFMPGSAYLVVAYFIALSQYLRSFEVKYVLFCVLALLVFVLLGTRTVLASVVLVTIINIMLSRKISSKLVTTMLILTASVPIYFLFKDIFTAMVTTSQRQLSNINQDIRVRAAIFFLYEFFPNKLAYITGNGVPSNLSSYGMRIDEYKTVFGFYQSDIGIIGEFSKFGLIFIIAQLSIVIRAVFARMHAHVEFIRYTFMIIVLTIFTGPGLFSTADSATFICLLLYIMDVYRDKRFTEIHDSPELHT